METPPALRTARLLLRPPRPEDAAPLAAILREPAVAAFWPGYDEARVRDDLLLPQPDKVVLVITEGGGAPLGVIQYSEEGDPQYRHAGVDLFLTAGRHGQGLGPEAIRAVVEHLLGPLRHHRVVIDPACENLRAIRAYEKVGFRPAGVLRRYERAGDGRLRDGLLMELLAEDYRPAPPRGQGDGAAAAAIRLADEGDVPAILEMMEDFNRFEQIPWTRARGEAPLRYLVSHREVGLVALLEPEGPAGPAGYFVLTFGYDLEWDGRDAFLTELYLRPAARGAGLGHRAIAAVEAVARQQGARALHLMVRHENERARRLYQAAGFASPARAFLSKVLSRAPE